MESYQYIWEWWIEVGARKESVIERDTVGGSGRGVEDSTNIRCCRRVLKYSMNL